MWASLWVFLGFIYNAKQITDVVVGGTPYNHSSEQALYNKPLSSVLKVNWLYFQFQNHKRIQLGEGAVIVFVFYRFFENFMSFDHIHPPRPTTPLPFPPNFVSFYSHPGQFVLPRYP